MLVTSDDYHNPHSFLYHQAQHVSAVQHVRSAVDASTPKDLREGVAQRISAMKYQNAFGKTSKKRSDRIDCVAVGCYDSINRLCVTHGRELFSRSLSLRVHLLVAVSFSRSQTSERTQ